MEVLAGGRAHDGDAGWPLVRSARRSRWLGPARRDRLGRMRVVDLDRDMSDVIPTGMSPDSEFLFERMTEVTLKATCADPGRWILDVASGVGQDSVALARQGARVVGAEPSARMTAMAEAFGSAHLDADLRRPTWVRGWADALPFEDDAFDAAFCKGAMDHFDDPEAAVSEMARVTRRDGRVVLAIANFDSLACRVTRAIDLFRQDWLGLGPLRGRRGYDTPSDHFTRYELDLMKEQARRHVEIETVQGVSIGWGLPGWATLVCHLPRPLARWLLRGLDALARQWPTLADVIVVVGRPRRDSATTSA
ncbi:MAG TPA: methyltransferase domain-containing protein [Deltaproteobacteria bacterium]|nr:methyltransferase domain-containing protein [Deltaproteobacteria bacterium]